MINRTVAAALAASATLLAGCRAPLPDNVVLITLDTVRADRLGCYGDRLALTPTLDRLAREGTRFDRAYTPVPLTLPSHATLLSGFAPSTHGLFDNGMTGGRFPAPRLAETLAGAGYDSAAFVSAFVLSRPFGLDAGFALYDDGPAVASDPFALFHGVGDARERVDSALAWLARPRQAPFFLWLHLYDAHAPHVAPEPFGLRFPHDPYRGEIAFLDSQLARLIDALDRSGVARRTLVIVAADHGESLGEHGEETHGIFLYDATLRVPLILRHPGRVAAGAVDDDPATLADVAPTTLALLGLPFRGGDGVDLFSAAAPRGSRELVATSSYPERHLGWAALRALRQHGFKYIAAPRPELFALADDPGELHDLASIRTDVAAAMARRLAAVAEGSPARDATDAQSRAAIGALGYVAGAAPPPSASAPDPKDRIAEYSAVDRAYQLLATGAVAAAAASFREELHRNPDSLPAAEGLAKTLELLGSASEAAVLYRGMLARDPEHVEALARLAELARQSGASADEAALTARLVSLFPKDSKVRRRHADALERKGDAAGAESERSVADELSRDSAHRDKPPR